MSADIEYQRLTAGEVYRDRLFAEAEGRGELLVHEAARMITPTVIRYTAWDHRLGGEPLWHYHGPAADFAEAKAAAVERTGKPWASTAELIVRAGERAFRELPGEAT